MEEKLKQMDLSFFGTGKHKIMPEKFMETQGAIFLDVRAKEEVETLKFDFKYFGIQVIHIPFDELPNRLGELPKDKLIGTLCSSATRSVMAYVFLYSKGFENVKWIDGGYEQLVPLLKPGNLYKKAHQK
ncbi:MAG: rhodanese-like domain-containing protein [Bacteroidales bacterium]